MLNTFFRSPTDAEYGQVYLYALGKQWIVEVNQGWWSEETKSAIHHRNQVTNSLATFDEANTVAKVQVQTLANRGFIYSLTRNSVPPDFMEQRELERSEGRDLWILQTLPSE